MNKLQNQNASNVNVPPLDSEKNPKMKKNNAKPTKKQGKRNNKKVNRKQNRQDKKKQTKIQNKRQKNRKNMKINEEPKEIARGVAVSMNPTFRSSTNDQSSLFQKKQTSKNLLKPIGSAYEVIETNEYEEHQKRQNGQLAMNAFQKPTKNYFSASNSLSHFFNQDSKKTTKNQKKIKRRNYLQNKYKIFENPTEDIGPLLNNSRENQNGRRSYRTRESILSIDKNLTNDHGKLSHHMRQIFSYLLKREVLLTDTRLL